MDNSRNCSASHYINAILQSRSGGSQPRFSWLGGGGGPAQRKGPNPTYPEIVSLLGRHVGGSETTLISNLNYEDKGDTAPIRVVRYRDLDPSQMFECVCFI